VTVADLGSTNGTLVDGQRIRGEAALRDGSVVRVGNTDVSVRFAREEG
jgi:pSer/pThr/pTyr-binding forkhead associated (FHA) protein